MGKKGATSANKKAKYGVQKAITLQNKARNIARQKRFDEKKRAEKEAKKVSE